MPAEDGGGEGTDNEMQNYEKEFQQCAQTVGIHYQQQEEADPASDNATDLIKVAKEAEVKGKTAHTDNIARTRPSSRQFNRHDTIRRSQKNVFKETAHLAAFTPSDKHGVQTCATLKVP